jgi:hypothetical protein
LSGVSFTASIQGVSCGASNTAGQFSCTTQATTAFQLKPAYSKAGYTFIWPVISLPATGNASVTIVAGVRCPSTGCRL